VLCVSAVEEAGIPELWAALQAHRAVAERTGSFQARRRQQRVAWMWNTLEAGLLAEVRKHPAVAAILKHTEEEVEAGRCSPSAGARQLLDAFAARTDSQEDAT
jgi:LAO/AO transport system kinase